jgi:hypothetical protein
MRRGSGRARRLGCRISIGGPYYDLVSANREVRQYGERTV